MDDYRELSEEMKERWNKDPLYFESTGEFVEITEEEKMSAKKTIANFEVWWQHARQEYRRRRGLPDDTLVDKYDIYEMTMYEMNHGKKFSELTEEEKSMFELDKEGKGNGKR